MKVKNLFIMSLAALSMVACSNDEDLTPKTSKVVVNLSSAAPKAKAQGDMSLASLTAEAAISSGTIYAFEGETFITSASITTSRIEIPGLTVDKTYNFVAVVNANVTSTTKDGLAAEVIALGTKSSFVMYGTSSSDLTIQADGNSFTMEVKRVLSGVQLVSVKTDFKEGTPVFATEGRAEVKSLQLLTTNPTSNLDGGIIAATSGQVDGLSATFTNLAATENISYVDVVNNGVRAYCCPGTVGYVVLNVTYTYQGETYDRAYNITRLSAGVVANTLYGLNVTLTGAGSEEGGNPDEFASANATLSVADWYDGSVIDVEQEN